MTFPKTLTAVVLATGLAAAAANAKGHDQSGTDQPGANVGQETVGPAQSLGKAKGNDGKNDGKVRGKSAEAGRDG